MNTKIQQDNFLPVTYKRPVDYRTNYGLVNVGDRVVIDYRRGDKEPFKATVREKEIRYGQSPLITYVLDEPNMSEFAIKHGFTHVDCCDEGYVTHVSRAKAVIVTVHNSLFMKNPRSDKKFRFRFYENESKNRWVGSLNHLIHDSLRCMNLNATCIKALDPKIALSIPSVKVCKIKWAGSVYSVDKKKMKKWVRQNYNRLLCPVKTLEKCEELHQKELQEDYYRSMNAELDDMEGDESSLIADIE